MHRTVISRDSAVLPPIVRCAKARPDRPWNESGSEQGRFREYPQQLGDRGEGRTGARSGLQGQRMNELLETYLPLVIFIAVAAGISLALLVVPFIVAYKQPDTEKLSAYECGFNAFDDA